MKSDILDGALVPIGEFNTFIRKVYLHRACLFLAGASYLFTWFLAPGDRLEAMDLVPRAIYNGAWLLTYYLLGYAVIGYILRFFMVRKLPFVWVTVGFYGVLAGVETISFNGFFAAQPDPAAAFWYWLTTMVMIVVSVVAVVHFFEEPMRENLSKDPAILPVWRLAKLSGCALEAQLPHEVRAPIRRLEAQNQYVLVVTEAGEGLLRMSLTQAEAFLPGSAGLRIHRSVWIRSSEIESLVSRDGNPRVRDKNGQEFPVSRQKVADVRRVLQGLA